MLLTTNIVILCFILFCEMDHRHCLISASDFLNRYWNMD